MNETRKHTILIGLYILLMIANTIAIAIGPSDCNVWNVIGYLGAGICLYFENKNKPKN